MLLDKYNEMKEKHENLTITDRQWIIFCQNCLEEIIVKKQQVLKRLKEK